jgi:hypothetical protein
MVDEIGDEGARVVQHHGAQRHRENEILTVLPMTQVALSVGAVAGGVMRVALIAEQ